MKAIIDLGTNTFHLLIAELKEEGIVEYFKLQIPVKLGRGGIHKHFIVTDAFERGIDALKEFRKYLDQFKVTDVKAFATSAIRNAENGDVFIETAWNTCAIQIETITGEEEAAYIYEGIRHSFTMPENPVLVMDIGGGSVEFIIGKQESILWKASFELGAARLLERFHKSDPIAKEELEQLKEYLVGELKPLFNAASEHQVKMLVGSAGSFETLVDVVMKDLKVVPENIGRNAFAVRMEDFHVFYELMITSTAVQRKRLEGMLDFRVEMITVAAVLMKVVVDHVHIEKIAASNYALKEGILFSE